MLAVRQKSHLVPDQLHQSYTEAHFDKNLHIDQAVERIIESLSGRIGEQTDEHKQDQAATGSPQPVDDAE